MAEVTNELMFELLKQIQARLGNLENGLAEVKLELRAMRGHLHAMQLDIANLSASYDALEKPTARIERRLELADVPLPT